MANDFLILDAVPKIDTSQIKTINMEFHDIKDPSHASTGIDVTTNCMPKMAKQSNNKREAYPIMINSEYASQSTPQIHYPLGTNPPIKR